MPGLFWCFNKYPSLCLSLSPHLSEYINNYSSSDLDPEIPDSLLGTWQDSPSAIGLQTDSRPLAREKLQPIRDIPVGGSLELPVQSPPPGPLPMDIEADIPVGMWSQT